MQRHYLVTPTLSLPKGQRLRFIHLPGEAIALSETEVPRSVLEVYEMEGNSHDDAVAFCEWLSEHTGERLRLPTVEEWRRAARGGIVQAEFVWGFGPPVPPEGLHFALETAPDLPGPAFGYGFRDLAGGRWEWTAEGVLLGSAWSERNPETLYIDHAFHPPAGYAGRDTAIRLVWERK